MRAEHEPAGAPPSAAPGQLLRRYDGSAVTCENAWASVAKMTAATCRPLVNAALVASSSPAAGPAGGTRWPWRRRPASGPRRPARPRPENGHAIRGKPYFGNEWLPIPRRLACRQPPAPRKRLLRVLNRSPGREFRYREADAGDPLLIPPAAGPGAAHCPAPRDQTVGGSVPNQPVDREERDLWWRVAYLPGRGRQLLARESLELLL